MWIRYKQKQTRQTFWKHLIIKYREASTKTLWISAGVGAVGLVLTGLLTFQLMQYRLRTSDYNLLALEELAKHPKVIDLLGEPVKAGYVYSRKRGSIQIDKVDCVVPVSGKNADGLIKYQADKFDNEWIIRRMEFSFLDPAGGVIRLVRNKTDLKTEIIVDKVNKS